MDENVAVTSTDFKSRRDLAMLNDPESAGSLKRAFKARHCIHAQILSVLEFYRQLHGDIYVP